MQATINIPMDGQMLKRLIESTLDSAQRASDPLASAQFSLLVVILQDKLTEFHKASEIALISKYCSEQKGNSARNTDCKTKKRQPCQVAN
jgi:hypothetical protein